jgi:hypothetical protein
MLHERTLTLAAVALLAGACHGAPAHADGNLQSVQRTVFTDSLLHAERCAPVKAGEDWRRICTPKDQSVLPKKAPPPQPDK